jgi:hypothetical protein
MNSITKAIIIFVGFLVICECDYASAGCDKAYATVGAGYKFHESTTFLDDAGERFRFKGVSKYSARIEAGIQCNENIRVGISHHSQWLDGAPFNDRGEPFKTEVFIDYTYYWDI